MKRFVALLLTLALVFALCACGNSDSASDSASDSELNNESSTTEEEKTEQEVETEAVPKSEPEADSEAEPESSSESELESQPEPAPESEPESEPVSESIMESAAVEIAIGDTISLDFVELNFAESGVAKDITQSVKTGYVTKITGPEPLDGQQYIYLRGTIKNLAKEELPVYDFFLGEFDLDGYKYGISANDCDVISGDGSLEQSIPPLTTYTFTMYAAIPDELANTFSTSSFRFGFYDMFDNAELARNRSFEDDPISLCPYLYVIKALQ